MKFGAKIALQRSPQLTIKTDALNCEHRSSLSVWRARGVAAGEAARPGPDTS